MSNRKYIDFNLIEKVPNKYNIKPKGIKKLKVLDWDKLKKKTWYNEAKKDTGEWYCHLEGSNGGGFYGDNMDEFWIGFNKKNGKVDYWFTSCEGMCGYTFDEFYTIDSIENKWDMNVQVNAMKFLNMLLDDGIVGLNRDKSDMYERAKKCYEDRKNRGLRRTTSILEQRMNGEYN